MAAARPELRVASVPAAVGPPTARRAPFPAGIPAVLARESARLATLPRERLAELVGALVRANPSLALDRLILLGAYDRVPYTHVAAVAYRDDGVRLTVVEDGRPVQSATLVLGRDGPDGPFVTAALSATRAA